MALCDSGSSISFVDQSVVSTLQLQGRQASLSVAGIYGSEDVKTEIVPIAVSAADKTRPLSTVQFYVHKNLKLGNQNLDLPELKNSPSFEEIARQKLQCESRSNDSRTRLL